MSAEALGERLLEFAARIVAVVDASPKRNRSSRPLGEQLLRAGTAVGANFEESRGAESRADFAHKMQVALKEAREARYWLRLIARTKLLDSKSLAPLLQESLEIILILSKSVATLKGKSRPRRATPAPAEEESPV